MSVAICAHGFGRNQQLGQRRSSCRVNFLASSTIRLKSARALRDTSTRECQHDTCSCEHSRNPVHVYAHVERGKTESGHREDVYAGREMVSPISMSPGHREPFPRNPALTSWIQGTVPGWHRPA